jgi:hypothetical protein
MSFSPARVNLDAVESVITTCGVVHPELSPFYTVTPSIHPSTHTHTHMLKVKNHKICRQEYSKLRCIDSDFSSQTMLRTYQSFHKVLLFRPNYKTLHSETLFGRWELLSPSRITDQKFCSCGDNGLGMKLISGHLNPFHTLTFYGWR